MTITPVTPKGFRTNLPAEPPAGLREVSDDVIVISIDNAGILRVNQKEVELANLSAQLMEVYKTRYDKTAFLQADSELLFDQIARVIDVAKGSGVDRIGLMTRPF